MPTTSLQRSRWGRRPQPRRPHPFLPLHQPQHLIRPRIGNLDGAPEEFESKPLRIEKVVPANSEATFQVRALKPGRYKFVGEFHEDSAKGELVVE